MSSRITETTVARDYYRNFMDAVISNKPTLVTQSQELRVYAVMEAAKKSSDENRVIELDI